MERPTYISVIGAREHNLKDITVRFPRAAVTVITGPSGSGKSSLAFDTIFAEGQRRYVESLSTHARRFLDQLPKPDVDRIEGLTPTIAIAQRTTTAGPRSTVATSTEIHDFLRVLYARVGEPFCWLCGRAIERQSVAEMVDAVLEAHGGRRVMILAPLCRDQSGDHADLLARLIREGFVRARIDGEVRALEETQRLDPGQPHTIEVAVDRLVVRPDVATRLSDSIATATRLGKGRMIVAAETDSGAWDDRSFSAVLACPIHEDVRVEEQSPRLFSFNSPNGACEACTGLGIALDFDPSLVAPDPRRSIADGAIEAFRGHGPRRTAAFNQRLRDFCEENGVSEQTPIGELSAKVRKALLWGEGKKRAARFEGVIPILKRIWLEGASDALKQRLRPFMSETRCERCGGDRLRPEATCVKIAGKNIAEVVRQTFDQARTWFADLRFPASKRTAADPLLHEINQRLKFLCDAGVNYLTLDRASYTLSGGEWQRIRLATQIGGGLSGICYVLDEPTIGLHPRDCARLADLLSDLAQLDNTVIVVDHDEQIIRRASHMIDIGPGAAAAGGRLLAAGTVAQVLADPESPTATCLSGSRSTLPPNSHRIPDWSRALQLHGANANNLKNLDVHFPLGCFVCVTGVSGSGKSTLVADVLLKELRRRRSGAALSTTTSLAGADLIDEIIEVDQTPIGRTPRSNPATHVGLLSPIRELFAQARESKVRGYTAARFSFNVAGGRCEHCEGQGTKRVSLHLLPDVFVQCAACAGTRYNRETLEVRFRGKSIADVLAMDVDEALAFFENFPNIARRLSALRDVGLGYLRLGQSAATLSGGEAQRLKLADALHRDSTARMLFVLDEPTTGLHFVDVARLLDVLHRLVDRGQTVLCVEHDLDVIRTADWIIDLGPEGGDAGGELVVQGPPETIAACTASHTGRFLAKALAR